VMRAGRNGSRISRRPSKNSVNHGSSRRKLAPMTYGTGHIMTSGVALGTSATGERPSRATAHLIASHNPGLAEFVSSNKFTIEVAGPFATEEVGRAVETVLISALEPDLNIIQGSSAARLRPLGVPVEFAPRLSLPPMKREDFISVQGNNPMPIMFVFIGQQDFGDGRVGYDPANPPSDEQVLERVEKWWQIQRFLPEWSTDPQGSPGVLIGVHGKPGAQMVIASLMIDRSGWNSDESFERGEGKIRVPTLPTRNLDAFEIRGRRIDRASGIAFEGFPAGFFVLLSPDGTLAGGRRTRRPKHDESV